MFAFATGKIKKYWTRITVKEEGKKIFSNASWLLAEKIIRLAVSFLVGIWMARYLGPTQYGILNYAAAWIAIATIITSWGLTDSLIVRDLVREPGHNNVIVFTSLALRLLSSILLYSLMLLFLQKSAAAQKTSVMIMILGIGMIFQSFEIFDFWFQSQVKSKYVVIAKALAFLTMNVLKVIAISLRWPLEVFGWCLTGELIISAGGYIFFFYRIGGDYTRKKMQISIDRALTLLKQSWPLLMSGLGYAIYMKTDQIMLGNMIGAQAVGLYSVATKVTEVCYFLPMVIVSSVFPNLIKIKLLDASKYYERLQKLYDGLTALALMIIIPTTLFSYYIIVSLFGGHYQESAYILAIHIWGLLFTFNRVAFGKFLVIEGLLKFSFISNAIGAIINVAANLYAIPRWQGQGAAVATIISYFISLHVAAWFFSKTRNNANMILKAFFIPFRSLIYLLRVGRTHDVK